jgi:hypothetical protein
VDRHAWAAGATALRSRDRDLFTASMAAAFGLDPGDAAELAAWWNDRARW